MQDAVAIVPAITAAGEAIVSNKLSTQGIKYPITSTTVATDNVRIAILLPIHAKFEYNVKCPVLAEIPIISNGMNTLNPQAALKPIPIDKLNKNSINLFSNNFKLLKQTIFIIL